MNPLGRPSGFKPFLIWTLILSVLHLSLYSGTAFSAFLPSEASPLPPASSTRQADLKAIQAALESRTVAQRLSDLGLTPGEVFERMNRLSDEQIHELALHPAALQPGGDAAGFLVFLILVGAIVVLVLHATGHKVIITR